VKYSFSTNAFTRFSLLTALEIIAGVGYRAVEILADAPHLYADTIDTVLLANLKEDLDRLGLAVANVNANTAVGYYNGTFWEPLFEPSLANPDNAARQWRVNYTKNCITIAKTLGARTISITSGRMVPGVQPSESLDIFYTSLKEILPFAEAADVKIGIEYEPGLLIENCEELGAFLGKVDSPWLGANLDIGHSYVARENIKEVVESLADKIFHVHLEDISGRKHFHLVPGQGDIDFDAIFSALQSQSYKGYVTVELYSYPGNPAEIAAQAIEYLKQWKFWN
jgi:sugar phosphate isomerase/epimerase